MPVIFDARAKDHRILREADQKGIDREVQQLMESAVAENYNRPYLSDKHRVCVVHRTRPGVIRWFNFNPNYAGSWDHAWQVVTGKWRLADDDEIKAALIEEDKTREDNIKSAELKAAVRAQRVMERMVSAYVQQAPSVLPVAAPVSALDNKGKK